MVQDTDETILQRIAERDLAAFGLLYDRYSGRFHALARLIVEDDAQALAAVKEGFMHLWNLAPSYTQASGKAYPWIVKHFRQKVVGRQRAVQRRAKILEDVSLSPLPVSPITQPDAEGQQITKALAKLPEQQRRCIEWSFLKGLNLFQLADVAGTTATAAAADVREGMQRCNELLKGDNP